MRYIFRRVSRAQSTAKSSLFPRKRSADSNGAQPTRMGVFRGMFVHQVGNHSSSENKKLRSERVLPFEFGGRSESQNRSRKRSTTRTTFPISSFSRLEI